MIPKDLVIVERQHWIVNHRIGSTYPGYLMVASKQAVGEVSELCPEALEEMGKVLADVERAILATYNPYKVLIAKLGFTKGFNCHFHVVPVHAWILKEIELSPKYADEPDGNDVMLYVNREYCENQNLTDSSVVALKAVNQLRGTFASTRLQEIGKAIE